MQNTYKVFFPLIFTCRVFFGNASFLFFAVGIPLDNSFSQTTPGIEWQNTIGGSNNDWLYSTHQTADGGYILGGFSWSNISGDKTENNNGVSLNSDLWIVKIDATGNILWQNTIGGNYNDVDYSIRQTSDGGYILGGSSLSNISGDKTENCIGDWDYWIVKTDSVGNVQWQNTIGGNDEDGLSSIQQTNDGGYILGGWSQSNISGDKMENCLGFDDYWVVKIDAVGNIQWQNTIGGNDDDLLYSICQTMDGGYILSGTSYSNISGDKTENCIGGPDYWIVKTDATGNIQWQNTIGGSSWDGLNSIQQTFDGGYIISGDSYSNASGDKAENSMGGCDYWIVKIDSIGNIQWQNTIGGSEDDAFCFIHQTNDKGYIIGGNSSSSISGDKMENNLDTSLATCDYWIVKTDSAGNIQWQNTIGGSSWDELYSIEQIVNGGYIMGGTSYSNISGDKTENCIGISDYWVIKLTPDTITGISNFQHPTSNFQFSPNPLTTQSRLTFKNTNKEKFLFTLYDITGRITETVSTITNEIVITKGSKQPGVYLYNLMNEKTGESVNRKIVIND